jgi:phosphoserine phosphatase
VDRPSGPDGRLPAAVLWDMDGTLVDSEKVWDISLHALAEHLGGRLSRHTREAMVGANTDRTLRLLFAEIGQAPEPQALAEAGGWLAARTAELFRAGLPWRPGAEQALRAVRDSGLPTALVTSTVRELTELALDTIGREYFDAVVCGDAARRNRPRVRGRGGLPDRGERRGRRRLHRAGGPVRRARAAGGAAGLPRLARRPGRGRAGRAAAPRRRLTATPPLGTPTDPGPLEFARRGWSAPP